MIGIAWEKRAVLERFSDNEDTRLKQFKEQKFTEHEVKMLNMTAKSIIGVRLDSPEGNRSSPQIGLVVIEHTARKGLSAEHMEGIQESLVFDTLRHLIHPARAQLMELSSRAEKK